uniref:Sodium/calcium exchanger membrane region domain-containing protein n=1 Tax=Chrysotila carterae TaxID=13221 RepID=A0A7S4BVW1_CHRCT
MAGKGGLNEKLLSGDDADNAEAPHGAAAGAPSKKHSVKGVVLAAQATSYIRRRNLLIRQKSKADVFQKSPKSFFKGSRDMLCKSWLNSLLVSVPFALAIGAMELSPAATFITSCLAILPLAGLLGDATEQLASHTNETIGGLLNATFGNATELIVAIFALQKGLLNVVQVSLLGSILSNTLLVLGCSCIAGGLTAAQVKFNQVAAQANTTLLQIAILGLVVPTMMESVGQLSVHGTVDLLLSRTISCALLVLYLFYVYFQLFTHRAIFEADSKDSEEEEEEAEEVLLTLGASLGWLGGATVLIAFISEFLTGAIDEAAIEFGLSETFVGFVILPIIGNAAEHSTAIVMAAKGKMDLSFGVALGSSTQIALFVIPLLVLLGWAIDQPLDLYFGVYETVIVFLSTLIVSQVVADGETNWLEGIMLIFAYLIICLSFFFYHSAQE